ncbi:hypothetical protein BMETH_2435_0 [methanotrophic bacterial endosymbiont of Bathymodiolus sp.]|nr:hypothetical protein BMETH_2435_0 [methanotrophic bacterial endosymbiont of Bathymodiolus sp.]
MLSRVWLFTIKMHQAVPKLLKTSENKKCIWVNCP